MKFIDVIEYEGDNETFIWKHPCEDFNTLSQLNVHESQEAILFLNGRALDTFGAGRHTLHTQNIPILSKILNIPSGGETPFHCEVYFINKTEQMSIKWGIGDVQFSDPTYNDYTFELGASGELSLRLEDGKKALVKLVGTEKTLTREKVMQNFKPILNMHIKNIFPKILRQNKISIFSIDEHLTDLASAIKEKIADELWDYGFALEKLWINTIVKPENDMVYQQFNQLKAEEMLAANQGKIDMTKAEYDRKISLIVKSGEIERDRWDVDLEKYRQDQLGYTRQEMEKFEVLKLLAQNEGSGSDLRNSMLGIGMGVGMGGIFGEAMNDVAASVMMSGRGRSTLLKPEEKGISDMYIPGMVDLKEERTETSNEEDADLEKKIQKYKKLLEMNMISKEDYLELVKKL